MTAPVYSIIVPCYKVESYIVQCVESILAQKVTNFECIAVDDGSPDKTPLLLDNLAERDSRIKVLHLPQNGGVSNARNKGLDIATGTWVMFVDGDDFLPPDALELLNNLSEAHPSSQMICANALLYSADGRQTVRPHFFRHETIEFNVHKQPELFLKHQNVFDSSCMKLFKREPMLSSGHRFISSLRYGEDTLFTNSYLLCTASDVTIDYDAFAYGYRQQPDSCIHSIDVDMRLNNLRTIITKLDELARAEDFLGTVTSRKAAEYLWCIKRFSLHSCKREKLVKELLSSDFYMLHLKPALAADTKWRHKIVLWLMEHHLPSAIRWW